MDGCSARESAGRHLLEAGVKSPKSRHAQRTTRTVRGTVQVCTSVATTVSSDMSQRSRPKEQGGHTTCCCGQCTDQPTHQAISQVSKQGTGRLSTQGQQSTLLQHASLLHDCTDGNFTVESRAQNRAKKYLTATPSSEAAVFELTHRSCCRSGREYEQHLGCLAY